MEEGWGPQDFGLVKPLEAFGSACSFSRPESDMLRVPRHRHHFLQTMLPDGAAPNPGRASGTAAGLLPPPKQPGSGLDVSPHSLHTCPVALQGTTRLSPQFTKPPSPWLGPPLEEGAIPGPMGATKSIGQGVTVTILCLGPSLPDGWGVSTGHSVHVHSLGKRNQ